MCGENEGVLRDPFPQSGSSPRVRGKLCARKASNTTCGLIPACAGKTLSWFTARRSRPAHPRVCGENTSLASRLIFRPGSSPRVRGKHCAIACECVCVGLIPACAGKTHLGLVDRLILPAHPRVCGENTFEANLSAVVDGSSPRVRGKQSQTLHPFRRPRLIPACAGKTRQSLHESGDNGAHPRVCGENAGFANRSLCAYGSSPRVRGKLPAHRDLRRAARLIPACAGKTRRRSTRGQRVAAHPRVCGENPVAEVISAAGGGSSPRVRGKLELLRLDAAAVRLIPACAGKTWAVEPSRRNLRAHPRVCGENFSCDTRACVAAGSSPRVRGKQFGHLTDARLFGLIPACAGKTAECFSFA